MSGWVIIAVVAILVWGVLRFNRDHNRHQDERSYRDTDAEQALLDATRERDELRERVQVLERIVTDNNMPAAKKTKKIEAEIEALRELEDNTPAAKSADKEETSR